jgi:hypothetical protein
MLVSAETLAVFLDRTPRYVRQLAQTRVIPAQVEPAKYDLFKSIHAYVTHLQNRADGAVLTGERMRLVKSKADIVAMECDRMRDELVPRDQADAVWEATVARRNSSRPAC